jgi:hypothetical protein
LSRVATLNVRQTCGPGLDVGEAEQRARRQLGWRRDAYMTAAVDGPDLDHEVELLVGQRADLVGRDLALVAQRQRHLAQLVVEQRLGLGKHAAVGHRADQRSGEREHRQQRQQQADADRRHAGSRRRRRRNSRRRARCG